MAKPTLRYPPDYALHPGAVLRMEIEAREIAPERLAALMQSPPEIVNSILAEQQDIIRETAEAIEAALGVRAQSWLNLQELHDQILAEIHAQREAAPAEAD